MKLPNVSEVAKKLSCKIAVSVLIALASFYAVSGLERSFQISIVPSLDSKVTLTKMDEIYEVRFFIFNKGWSDRTLTGIELEAASDVKETMNVLREHEKNASAL